MFKINSIVLEEIISILQSTYIFECKYYFGKKISNTMQK